MRVLATVALLMLANGAAAQDMRLSQVLVDGEPWKEVKLPFGKPVALSADAGGKLFLSLTNHSDTPGVFTFNDRNYISRYNTTNGEYTALALDDKGTLHAVGTDLGLVTLDSFRTVKALHVTTRQLGAVAAAPGGAVYYLDGANKAIRMVGRDEPVAKDIGTPGGLALWKDGGTLVVGDAAGKHLYTFRVAKDGTLDAKEAYYTLRTRPRQPSGVVALTIDDAGRLYAATSLGVQMFDPTGRLSGVMPGPLREPVTALAFAGAKRDQLFIVCGGKLWQRKTKAKGAWPPDAKDK